MTDSCQSSSQPRVMSLSRFWVTRCKAASLLWARQSRGARGPRQPIHAPPSEILRSDQESWQPPKCSPVVIEQLGKLLYNFTAVYAKWAVFQSLERHLMSSIIAQSFSHTCGLL